MISGLQCPDCSKIFRKKKQQRRHVKCCPLESRLADWVERTASKEIELPGKWVTWKTDKLIEFCPEEDQIIHGPVQDVQCKDASPTENIVRETPV